MDAAEFSKIVLEHYKKHGRSLPWKEDCGAWGVFVSEFMLQQTQVGRVLAYWRRWMERWPTPASLAAAALEEALREWSGLGYNRRCRFLRESAAAITERFGGVVPAAPEELVTLPGVGAYTAGAVACFAYNYPSVFIETNIRSAIIHCFFPGAETVPDTAVAEVLERCLALNRKNPKKWYYALMDYGAALKKITANPNRRSAAYTVQGAFEGSFRQLRGRVLRSLTADGPAAPAELCARAGIAEGDVYRVLEALEKELMVAEEEGVYRIG